MKYFIVAFGIMVIAIPGICFSASAGNPASTIGKETYGITLEGEEQIKRLDGEIMRSRRYVGKIIWGMADRLDVYARLGASDLRVENPDYPDFKTAPRSMTWGGGLRYLLAESDDLPLEAYIDVQFLSFKAKASSDVEKTVSYGGWSDTYFEHHYTSYRYKEFQFSFITIWRHEVFSPYGGFALTNVSGHVDRKVTSDVWEGVTEEGNDFREYGIAEAIAGMDIDLGGTGRFSFEVRLSDDSDISYFIGVSELTR